MYIHLQSARVFPNDATSDSFPTSPSSPLLQNPFLASKISLGFYFVFFGVIVPGFSRQFCLVGGRGQPWSEGRAGRGK